MSRNVLRASGPVTLASGALEIGLLLLLLLCPYNTVNFGPLAAISLVWDTAANFNRFRVLVALLHGTLQWASAKLCDVVQRAPPIFGRAAIALGIGRRSSQIV